ncbi:hypothetical protein SLEP1_g46305 [Rubroshorea leprosula]|uniref:Uncharacterized protein n=1 Tax=Rubroshorea leprosula TaxID=152421 RepID=A0AAV5LLT5_9ROSI|nr:hypothetical protein SLEP1_g46305 [Rubroshorea leprosula]
MFPIIKLTRNPHPQPNATAFQPNSASNPESSFPLELEDGGGEAFELSHFLHIGNPHNPKFPSNELLSNVSNC